MYVLAMGGYKRDWEELAALDSKWAIVSDPRKRGKGWEEKEFFETGRNDVKRAIKRIEESGGKLKPGSALDFGCGIGRLSAALSGHFKRVIGVDASSGMIREAKKLHKSNKRLEFLHNPRDDLLIFDNKSLDLVYSEITLQHIPDVELIESFIKEFVRVLKPKGILYFQLPSRQEYSPMIESALKLRGLVYYGLTGIGVPKGFCFSKLRIAPYMQMSHISMERICKVLNGDAEILGIYERNSRETTYVVRKR
jgi:SAM-dependent methyltransferase